jgi:hypothetical protein
MDPLRKKFGARGVGFGLRPKDGVFQNRIGPRKDSTMRRLHLFFAIFCMFLLAVTLHVSNLAGGAKAFAAGSTLPVPSSLLALPPYGPIASPVLNSDPAQAMPIAVGAAASGGSTLTVRLQTYPFDGPVDVYFAFSAPALDPLNLYIITPSGAFPIASAGLVPYMTSVMSLDDLPFGSIPVSSLPPGTYSLFLGIMPSGSQSAFDIWTTELAVDGTARVLYIQPPSTRGMLYHSSRWDPDGSDYDAYVWDDFTLAGTQTISRVTWRGGYDPERNGSGGPVIDFIVSIYASIPAGVQPDVANPPLVRYHTGGNGGQTPAGLVGGTTMYDYAFTLPTPFQAIAGTKYWIQIEALQHAIPDWFIAAGAGGDGKYYRRIPHGQYQTVDGDAAFSLK